jgi:uncharacterized paraquat-inducible protein A
MRNYIYKGNVAVWCIYCHKEFILKGQQKWHNCKQAMSVRKKIERDRTIEWRKKEYKKRPEEASKDNWKLCKKCKNVLTPNYFGTCASCLDTLGSQIDIDMIIEFDGGHEKRNGVWVR